MSYLNTCILEPSEEGTAPRRERKTQQKKQKPRKEKSLKAGTVMKQPNLSNRGFLSHRTLAHTGLAKPTVKSSALKKHTAVSELTDDDSSEASKSESEISDSDSEISDSDSEISDSDSETDITSSVKQKAQKNKSKTKPIQTESDGSENPAITTKTKRRYILFVGNIPLSASREEIVSHFERRGIRTSDFRLLTHKDSGKSKGCGFLELDSEKMLHVALKLHRSKVKGRHINVEATAGGGGKSEQRKAKIVKKNRTLRRKTAVTKPTKHKT